MAIFYDDVNESWGGGTLNTIRSGNVRPMVDPTTLDLRLSTGRPTDDPPPSPTGAVLEGWPDELQHNEQAARLIAEAIFAEIEPDLRALVDARSDTGATR